MGRFSSPRGRTLFARCAIVGGAALGALAPVDVVHAQQINPDEAALILLGSAQKAYNDKNYPAAADRFRDFLRQFGGRREAAAAQYGLALSLIEQPGRNWDEVIAALQQPSGDANFPEQRFAIYQLGVAHRARAAAEYRLSLERPTEAPQHVAAATQRYEEALRDFQRALPLFQQQAKAQPAAAPPQAPQQKPGSLSVDLEWLMRVQCDLTEMLLRTGKFKEARDAIVAAATDPAYAASRYHAQAVYQLGYANFSLRDYPAAGKMLSGLAPFDQDFGLQARYLLGRVHHLMGERVEAAQEYKAVIASMEAARKAAQQALQTPQNLSEARRSYLEFFLNGPRPDYFVRCNFYLNVILSEQGDYAPAIEGLNPIAQQNPRTPLSDEAQLRVGFCYAQTRNFDEARRRLEPLRENPEWGDQALWFLGRIPIAAADQNNPQAVQQAATAAIEIFRRAAEKAAQIAQQPNHEDAKLRRLNILLELADAQQLTKKYPEASETYRQVLAENPPAALAEEAMQRQVTALQMAAQYPASDELAQRFINTYPHSVLMGEVLFRRAENSYLAAAALAAEPNRRHEETDPMFQEAARRYQAMLERFPESNQASLARQGLGNSYYRLGDFQKCQQVLEQIPAGARAGELSSVAYLLADCRIRAFPLQANDALSAERLIHAAEDAAAQLRSYIEQQPKSPQTPDALVKIGYCQQRIGELSVDPKQRLEHFNLARQAYERIPAEFGQSPAAVMAVFERARCQVELGDIGNAVNELNRFGSDPLRAAPIAPMALLRSAVLQRTHDKQPEALATITRCRELFEVQLYGDPSRADWVPMIQYEQGMCQQAAGKFPEARATFEIIARQFAKSPQAPDATWRAGQCRRAELAAQLAAARLAAAKPDAKVDDVAAAGHKIEGLLTSMRQLTDTFTAQADTAAKDAPGSEAHLHTLYELAWCQRLLGDAQVELARQKMQREVIQQLAERSSRDFAAGQKPTVVVLPSIGLVQIPVQPAEQAARDAYQKLIAAAPDSPTANDARLELAELLSARADNDGAIDLLYGALEHGATGNSAERAKLRLAAAHLGRHEPQEALRLLKAPPPSFPIPGTDASAPPQPPPQVQPTALAMEGRYLTGEALIQSQDWPKAIEQLLVFRDTDPYRSEQTIADRALLRLGFAFAQSKQWDQSRQSYEALFQRFNQSPLVDEAHFGSAIALQNLKQWDNAVNQFNEVVHHSAGEVAAKAQYQIGLCQLELRRFPEAARSLVGVAYTYNYPEYSAAAQTEAARAYVEMKQPADARKVLQRVMDDYPQSPWAQTAKERLATVPQ